MNTFYVRKRRLTAAAYELISTERRILDIALDYRFLTQESFTRAFKMMQMFRADKYKGKRLRLSGFVKTESTAYAGLWMRIDGKFDDILAFDNMSNRPIKGTTNWNQYSVVLDVSQDSVAIAFGFLLSGTGTMWVDSLRFDVVDEKVPTTNIEDVDQMPDEPINLNFEGQTVYDQTSIETSR